jgi:hypothetical protein
MFKIEDRIDLTLDRPPGTKQVDIIARENTKGLIESLTKESLEAPEE